MRIIQILMKSLLFVAVLTMATDTFAQRKTGNPTRRYSISKLPTVYDFVVADAEGDSVSLSKYKGSVLLIVNTAGKCGYTPQYEGLEALYKEYSGRGLMVLAFPCNQFGEQEPGSNAEIQTFCRENYGVTFPVLAKTDVNGAEAEPLFSFLKGAAVQTPGADIRWNFTKFLIGRDGRTVSRYEPGVKPSEMRSAIELLLSAGE